MNTKVVPLHTNDFNCEQFTARVLGKSGSHIMLDAPHGVINATKAFSCLVDVEQDDIVVVNQTSRECHVLAILDRPNNKDVKLAFPADVNLCSPEGEITIASADGIKLNSVKKTSITSSDIAMNSVNMTLNSGKLDAHINEVDASSETVNLKAGVISTVAKQISEKTDNLMRWVEGVETLSIGNLIQNVRRNYTSHSNQAVITAKEDIRVDGKRIHMG